MSTMWRIRPATTDDLPFCRLMLYEAAFWETAEPRPPLDEFLADPYAARYVEGWSPPVGAGVIAEDAASVPIGAAWYKHFSPDAPGYGFINATTPELAIAVASAYRGQGLGTALLNALLNRAGSEGISALSLSVEEANPAMRLYERIGFHVVGRNGDAWTMKIDLT